MGRVVIEKGVLISFRHFVSSVSFRQFPSEGQKALIYCLFPLQFVLFKGGIKKSEHGYISNRLSDGHCNLFASEWIYRQRWFHFDSDALINQHELALL